MYSFSFTVALALAFVALDAFAVVRAAIYVVQPLAGSTCSGGSPCTVQWLDDGTSPVNSEIGVSTCGLYTGNMQLVQTITPVDVANTQSLTFTPIPNAGPDASNYYIAFTSTNLEVNGTKYTGYSSFFRLDNMNGSFSSPLASATTSIAVPSSLIGSSASSGNTVLSTITVGTVTTSISPTTSSIRSTTASSSRFSTIASSSVTTTSSSSASVTSGTTRSGSSSSSSATSAASSSNAAVFSRQASLPFVTFLAVTVLFFL